jgi:hypothetical protein
MGVTPFEELVDGPDPRRYTINATCQKSTPEIRLFLIENATHVSAVVIKFRRQD